MNMLRFSPGIWRKVGLFQERFGNETAFLFEKDGSVLAMGRSGGDDSYPGFIDFRSARALVSYYSSHERDASGKTITAIYLVRLGIDSSHAWNISTSHKR